MSSANASSFGETTKQLDKVATKDQNEGSEGKKKKKKKKRRRRRRRRRRRKMIVTGSELRVLSSISLSRTTRYGWCTSIALTISRRYLSLCIVATFLPSEE